MKHPPDLRPLLDDVLLPEGSAAGPSRAEVLALVRREKQRGPAGAMLVLLMMTAAVAWLWLKGAGPVPETPAVAEAPAVPAATAPAPSPAPVYERIDDEQLLLLLKDRPAALLEWPDGGRTLLVMHP